MSDNNEKAKIVTVDELLQMNLSIPDYQRPYKWTRKNVSELLDDIDIAIEDKKRYNGNFQYRVGTIMLHKSNDKYEIVDGQQRIITLSIIKYVLDPVYSSPLLSQEFKNKTAIFHMQDNCSLIRDRIATKDCNSKKEINEAFSDTLEVVVLEVDHLPEAFQLFDSQNTRGRELYPHDLLKAYHLREMDGFYFEKQRLIKEWEAINPRSIGNLFSSYLYPIFNWSQRENNKLFTASEIEAYKGVPADCKYTYGQRVCNAMPYFQINESFRAGSDFFKMTSHYVNLLDDIRNKINNDFSRIKETLDKYSKHSKDNKEAEIYSSTGFGYAVDLFYCALLFFYDRFHSFNESAVKKLFLWAMMLRIDMQNLGLDSINKYALGDDGNNHYTNHIPMFYKIATARRDTDIADLDVNIKRADDKKLTTWKKLYEYLEKIVGGSIK